MNIQSHDFAAAPDSAFRFTGTWREFAPIALTNLLLTIVTLGIYRFWARARERRYLWSRTEFIDDTLEWTGTGREMFRGFFVVIAVLLTAYFILQFGLAALTLRGLAPLAAIGGFLTYVTLLFLFGLARFRALRYRLTRTLWHGIRGGTDEPGFRYGFSSTWKPFVGTFFFGLLIPWSMTELWNEKWNEMSFGPHPFTSGARSKPLIKRLLIAYVIGFATFMLTVMALGAVAPAIVDPKAPSAGLILQVLPLLFMMPGFGLAYVYFYTGFIRECVGNMAIADIEFGIEARTIDWLKLYVGDGLLIIGTLGIGYAFLSYRHWSFFVRNLRAYGVLDLDRLTQSPTLAGSDAEGLASAFDIGAI